MYYEDFECPADLFGAYCSGNCSICPYANNSEQEEDSDY
jgi:hypothetical protein|nr:MAG TPA: hypothetical protein [Caudoviricetes sp.]